MNENIKPIGWFQMMPPPNGGAEVRVTLEARQGKYVLLRQLDPLESDSEPIPQYAGDEYTVMEALSYGSINETDEVGDRTGLLYSYRIVPVRKEGNLIFARSLRFGEADSEERIHVRPGEQVTFEKGAILVELLQVDAKEPPTDSGYVPLTPVLATWFRIGDWKIDRTSALYLLAAARRLDATNILLMNVEKSRAELAQPEQVGPHMRRTMFELVSAVEMAVIALARAVDMVAKSEQALGTSIQVPAEISNSKDSLRAIRDAYEHINERALGNIKRGKIDSRALSIFDQSQLVTENRIVYNEHTLDLSIEVPRILKAARAFFLAVAGEDWP